MEEAKTASSVIQTLEALAKLPEETPVDATSAAVAVSALWESVPDPEEEVCVPGIVICPPGSEVAFKALDQWTVGLVLKAAELFAAAGRITTGALLFKCIQSAYENRKKAEERERCLLEKNNVGRYLWSGKSIVGCYLGQLAWVQ